MMTELSVTFGPIVGGELPCARGHDAAAVFIVETLVDGRRVGDSLCEPHALRLLEDTLGRTTLWPNDENAPPASQ